LVGGLGSSHLGESLLARLVVAGRGLRGDARALSRNFLGSCTRGQRLRWLQQLSDLVHGLDPLRKSVVGRAFVGDGVEDRARRCEEDLELGRDAAGSGSP